VKIWVIAAIGLSVCLLNGCISDPMRPSRPFGRRVPINVTLPPAMHPIVPTEKQETGEPSEGINDG